jgi:hypothetical protein
MLKSKTLYAMPFTRSRYDGDSPFYCLGSEVPYQPGMTAMDLKASMIKKLIKDYKDCNPESAYQEVREIIGFWIFDHKVRKIIIDLWSDLDPGNDSSTYACNSAAKHLVARMARKTLMV